MTPEHVSELLDRIAKANAKLLLESVADAIREERERCVSAGCHWEDQSTEIERLRAALEDVCDWHQLQDEPFIIVLERARAALQSKEEERRQGHSKLVYNKETRTIDKVDPHPKSGKEKLPDCMMPDGAGPCIGYEQLYAENAKLEKERDEAISQRNGWKRDFDYVYDERKSLRAENEEFREEVVRIADERDKLRKALQQMFDLAPVDRAYVVDDSVNPQGQLRRIREIGYAALQSKGE